MSQQEQGIAIQLGQDIFDKATFIAALMQHEFEPESDENIEIENSDPHALKHGLVTLGSTEVSDNCSLICRLFSH